MNSARPVKKQVLTRNMVCISIRIDVRQIVVLSPGPCVKDLFLGGVPVE